MSKILPCAALLIVLAIGDGAFNSALTAGVVVVAPRASSGSARWADSSQAYEASSNGSVMVGYTSNASGYYRAFRWTAATGMQDLGDFGYTYAAAYGVSADGSVVVGEAWNASFEQRAFRWTAAGGLQDLGTLGGPYAVAADVSANGTVVVGQSWTAGERPSCLSLDGGVGNAGSRHLRRLRQRGVRGLCRRLGRGRNGAATPAGSSMPSDGPRRPGWCGSAIRAAVRARRSACRRTARSSSDGLPPAVMNVRFGGPLQAGCRISVRWAATGARRMTCPPTVQSWSEIHQLAGGQRRAFRWTAAGGMQNLSTIYSGRGSGSYLIYANAVSADGLHVVGYGYNKQKNRYEAYSTN